VGDSLVQKLKMSQVKGVIGTLAQNNYYLVNIPLSTALQKHFSTSYNDDPQLKEINRFMSRLGYLCSEATLPTSSYATAEVKDNYMGVTQEFAHTRLYTDIDLTFYVDDEYSTLRFFEGWMDYIAGGNQINVEPAAASYTSSSPNIPSGLSPHIYRRFNFPDDYKVQEMVIYKFERDFNKVLEYKFVNAFPKAVTPLPVAYGPADILKVTVTFNFDRYVVRRVDLGTRSSSAPQVPTPKQTQPGQPPTKNTSWRYTQEQLQQFRDQAFRDTTNRINQGSQSTTPRGPRER
jgi:hypothetical protein